MTTEAVETPGVEDVDLTRTHMLVLMGSYATARTEESTGKKTKDICGKALKEYLEGHRGEDLYDGETGLHGFLQERNSARKLDFGNLPIELLNWLANHDCLKFDDEHFKGVQKKQVAEEVAQVERYLMPGTASESLQVRKEK